MFVGAGHFLDVFGGDVGFVARGFLGDAGAEDFGLGLEINDQIGGGNVRGEGFVVALVELELFVVEIEIGEDAVLFHEEVGEEGAGRFDGEGFAKAFLALDEEVHLCAKSGAGFGFVEIGEEGIVLAIVDAAGMEALRENLGKSSLTDAQGAFNDDEAGRLRAALRKASALGGGGVVTGHRFVSTRHGRGQRADYSRVAAEGLACVTAEGERYRRAKNVKDLPIYGLVLPFKKRQTEGLERRTKQNVTNGPVHPDLLYSKLTSLRVGADLQEPRAILRW